MARIAVGQDLSLMEAAHIDVVRVGEFAWSTMEPSEGNYDFGWLDRAIALAGKHHICVVLGTPTAAPPAWLTTKYPETLRVDNEGQRDEHGNRQQFSFTDPKYRQFAHAIAEQMAIHFGHNPNVVGWQLDNEYAAPSFDPTAREQFHRWLEKKYGTIAELNRRWATAYWSQTYDNFDEIPVHENGENPALLLEWKRFVSDTWKSYSENQISAIRPHADSRQFITTNTMGWFDGFDEYTVHSVLDIAAWDDYIDSDHFDYISNGATHDLTRGYKNKNFWVMETEPAFVNWRRTNTPLLKGQVRDMAWQAIGHGADTVEYWQWRSAPNGQEEYHGVLVGADGTPVPVYDEIQRVGEEFAKAGPALAGTSPHSEVALVNDYDSRWAINFQRHSANFDPVGEMLAFYRPLREQSQSVDIISINTPFDGYKALGAARAQRHLAENRRPSHGVRPQRWPSPARPTQRHEGRIQRPAARAPTRTAGVLSRWARRSVLCARLRRPGHRRQRQWHREHLGRTAQRSVAGDAGHGERTARATAGSTISPP